MGVEQTQKQPAEQTVGTTTRTPATGTTRSQEELATRAQSADAIKKSAVTAIGLNPNLKKALVAMSKGFYTDSHSVPPISTFKLDPNTLKTT